MQSLSDFETYVAVRPDSIEVNQALADLYL